MNEFTVNTDLGVKLEDFLDKACQAEAAGNRIEAERQFRLALYCEGKLHSDATNARDYVNGASPVYNDVSST